MWIYIGIFEALTASIISTITKHQINKINPIVLLFINQCFTIAFMIIAIIVLGGLPHITFKFIVFMLCSSILDTIAFISSYYAIKHTQISLLYPLGSLTPVFATLFGAVFLHEIPSFIKFLGIITIVFGVYLLNITDINKGFLKPFQKLISDKGVRLYFVQVIIFGITPIFQKQAIFQTHPAMPLFASFIGNTLVTLYLSFFVLKKVKQQYAVIIKNTWFFVIIGLFGTLSQLAAYIVFSRTNVGYATAIFSLASLFTIILGGIFFKENRIKEKLFGAIVMICGVILLTI